MAGTILVPIDVAQDSVAAESVELAKAYAAAQGGKLVLLSVRDVPPGYVAAHLPDDFEKKVRDQIGEKLNAIADAHGIAGQAELVVREGSPATEILEAAKELGAELIVIASHDPGIADYLLGSVAARIVRHAHCSVLVVRHPRS